MIPSSTQKFENPPHINIHNPNATIHETFNNSPNRTEKTTGRLIRHDLDHNEDLEIYLIDEDIQRLIYMTLFITLIIFLANLFGWG